MKEHISKEIREYLYNYLEDKKCDYEITHPWRVAGKYLFLHSHRVHNIAKQIITNENIQLSEDEKNIIEVACLFHDVGRIEVNKGHAENSIVFVKNMIENNKELANEIKDIDRLIEVIRVHSEPIDSNVDICSVILKDADELDEIGVMSVFMASNWLEKSSPDFFNLLLQQVKTKEIEFAKKVLRNLNTNYGKRILQDKLNFIEGFVNQLNFEMEGTHEHYNSEN